MAQETNLNVAPYYDDFDPAKDYHKILFKPGQPVQARELTGLQSILQNQVSKFGEHFFKEGSSVIPGQLSYFSNFYCIQVEENFLGVPISLYLDNLVGKVLTGETSGVEAEVKKVIRSNESENNNTTLYLSYVGSGTQSNESISFLDGENLLTKTVVPYGNTNIGIGQGVARTISEDSSQIGSAMGITEGVYFIRGYFVRVEEQMILLDQYGTLPSYRVGLDVIESIVNSDIDSQLVDNAAGFSNYAAPGADRLEIKAILSKRELSDTDDISFIELSRVENGQLKTFTERSDYNTFAQELARRTYDESGDYYIKPFRVNVLDSLDNKEGNSGLYEETETTEDGYIPSKDLMVYDVSSGKAYVKGYEVELISNTLVDVAKPRTFDGAEENISLKIGTKVEVNRTFGSAGVGIATTAFVTLRDQRIGAAHSLPSGQEIGVARVYDYNLEDEYVDDTSASSLRLFDIQYHTQVQANENFTSLSKSSFVEGQSSSATGFVNVDVTSGKNFTLSQVRGKFLVGERLIIDGVADRRIVAFTTSFDSSSVKSIHQEVGAGKTFNSDVVLNNRHAIGKPITIGAHTANASTITATKGTFSGISTTGSILVYNRVGVNSEAFARITSINSDGSQATVAGITTVVGVCEGGLPTSQTEVSNASIAHGNFISDNNGSFLIPLKRNNIAGINLRDTTIAIRRQYKNLTVSGSTLISPSLGENFFYLAFDEERYAITYEDGSVEPLTSDQFNLDSSTGLITFRNLSKASATNVTLTTTQNKIDVTPKFKRKQNAGIVTINRSKYAESGSSATGVGVKDNGLTYSSVYGTRVEDKEISLNTVDVKNVLAIFESFDTSDPELPTLTLTSITSPNSTSSDFIIGERIIGSQSRAVGRVILAPSGSSINFVTLNDISFIPGETIESSQSGINATVSAVAKGSVRISDNYTFDNGQRSEYYDYSRIIRKENATEPTRRLTIVYQSCYIESTDTGEIITANSYGGDSYSEDVALFDGRRTSDYIDIRPRLSDYNTSSTTSPFEFNSRSFVGDAQAPTNIIVSDENLLVNYTYYLGRIDKVYMGRNGVVQISRGTPSLNPLPPAGVSDSLEIATVTIPPYVYDINDIKVEATQHKRYTMRDIGKLEKRITNLEYYTALSLLEQETSSLQIKDAQGLDRFKNGFFVDNFGDHTGQNLDAPDSRCAIDPFRNILRPTHYTTQLDLEIATRNTGTAVYDIDDPDLELLDTNTRKTGDIVTLDYQLREYFKNPYATRVESVTPFLITQYFGTVKLTPASDLWVDQKRVKTTKIEVEGDYSATIKKLGINEQTGLGEITWGSWQETITGRTEEENQTSTETLSGTAPGGADSNPNNNTFVNYGGTGSYTKTKNFTKVTETGTKKRSGVANQVNVKIDTVSLGSVVLNTEIIQYMRSRNIQMIGQNMRPNTVCYTFFDKKSVTRFTTPKLIEIEMTSGTFFPGETVIGMLPGQMTSSPVNPAKDENASKAFKVRICRLNHRTGPILDPSSFYGSNPYNKSEQVPEDYSTVSKFLNIDTGSLAKEAQGNFFGYAAIGMVLRGETSGAIARVTNLRLVTDESGEVRGSVFIPNPNGIGNPSFTTGKKTFEISSDPNGFNPPSSLVTSAKVSFESAGTLENREERLKLIRNALITQKAFVDQETFSRNFETDVQLSYDQTVVVRPKPNTSGCSSRQIAFSVAITAGYSSYTAYHRAVPHSAYDLSFLINQPGAENCRTTGNESRGGRRSGRRSGGRRYSRRRGGRSRGGSSSRALATQVASKFGYSSYTAYHRAVSHSAYDRNFLENQLRGGGGGRSGRSGGGRSGGSRSGGGSNNSSAPRAMAAAVAKAAGYSSYTAYHRANPHNAYDTNFLKNKCGYSGNDPLAQSFIVEEENGVHLTAVDVYFQSVDDNGVPVRCEIRTLEGGLPSETILPFSQITLTPDQIDVSNDATIPTTFNFEAPVALESGEEYCFVLLSNSTKYGVWISRMGEIDLTGSLSEEPNNNSNRTVVAQQPLLGSLYKSQNASTWTPSQLEDLKMTAYKAEYATNSPAIVTFYSPELGSGNDQIAVLKNNPIEVLSKRATVGLGSTLSAFQESVISAGTSISQLGSDGYGIVVEVNGAVKQASNSINIVNAGVGYTPATGHFTFAGVALTSITGDGNGAEATIGVVNGGITTVTVTKGGTNYSVGDVLGIGTIGLGLGRNGKLSVGIISAFESLVIDQIQGEFSVGAASTLSYEVSAGIGSTLPGININRIDVDTTRNGTQFKVSHRNHCMHSDKNYVIIDNVQSDVRPTNILSDINATTTANIAVTNASEFSHFENVGVAASNPGYALIDGELISYTGVSGNTLTGITSRGVDSTRAIQHPAGSEIVKYELSGVSLRRINKQHYFFSPTITAPRARDLDYYYINVGMNTNGTDRSSASSFPELYFNETKSSGGSKATATQNIQFEAITPNIGLIAPKDTKVSATVRTISGSSVDGIEVDFVDQGYSPVTVGQPNYFINPRLVGSRVNETNYNSAMPQSRSMVLELLLETLDPNTSPMIDLDRVSAILTSNRVNAPITDFAGDGRVNQTIGDPHQAVYISKKIVLENPSTAIKVLAAINKPQGSDVRVLYRTFQGEDFDLESGYTLFPGHSNVDDFGNVINVADNDGSSNRLVDATEYNEFRDHEFMVSDIEPFTAFDIKIIMSSSNQSLPPKLKDLRLIALA